MCDHSVSAPFSRPHSRRHSPYRAVRLGICKHIFIEITSGTVELVNGKGCHDDIRGDGVDPFSVAAFCHLMGMQDVKKFSIADWEGTGLGARAYTKIVLMVSWFVVFLKNSSINSRFSKKALLRTTNKM